VEEAEEEEEEEAWRAQWMQSSCWMTSACRLTTGRKVRECVAAALSY
jgi:hypothetical protein